jgi:hypothetical protein
MAADDPNKPQSREAKVAAAKAEKAEDAAVDTYEAAVRKAASDLIDTKIKAAETYKAALLTAKAGVNRNRQKATSVIVRKALDEEIKRIDAEIKDATARRTQLLNTKRDLLKWQPPQPGTVKDSEDKSIKTDVKSNSKYATITITEIMPSTPKEVSIDSGRHSGGKIASWIDELPKQVAAVDGKKKTLSCTRGGYIVIGLADTDHKGSWVDANCESMKDTNKSIKIRWNDGSTERFRLWIGKLKAGDKRLLKKTGHHGHEILVFSNFAKESLIPSD